MKRFIILVVFMFQFGNSQVQYISPGISFSWDLNGRYIFSPKLSYGVLSNGLYINATIGSSSATDDKSYPNSYLEFQIGQIYYPTKSNSQLCSGVGMGITFPDNDSKTSLRLSVSTGFVVFANATFLFRDTTNIEIGGQIVAPIPLTRISM